MIPRALKFVRFEKIEDHFRLGWLMSFPNAPMHHHHYGCELAWICECPVPGGFETKQGKPNERNRQQLEWTAQEHRGADQ